MPEEGVSCTAHSEILTYEEIVRICQIGARMGISRIKLTGGEPLVRKGLSSLIRKLKSVSGIEQVTLTTNGVLLSEQLEELVDAGLDAVNISLDTLDKEHYAQITRGGDVSRVLESVRQALTYENLKVKLNCVPMKGTGKEEYIRLAEMAEKNPLEVRFIEMMPIGLGKQFAGIGGDEILEILKQEFGEPELYGETLGNGPARYVEFPGFLGRIGFISAVSHSFCDSCNRVRLTSEGNLKPCLQYGIKTDLKSLLRGGAQEKEIEEAIYRTIYEKPDRHCFSETMDLSGIAGEEEILETRGMSGIGG